MKIGFPEEQKLYNYETTTETMESSNQINAGLMINTGQNVEDSHDHIELKVIEISQEKSDSIESLPNNCEHPALPPSTDSSNKDVPSKYYFP